MTNRFYSLGSLAVMIVVLTVWGCSEPAPPEPINIGDNTQGGIVFYVDGTGQHGLVCASLDQSNSIAWCSGAPVLTNATNTAIGQGASNTSLIVSVQGAGSYAAKMCSDLVLNGYDDWFLPSHLELVSMKQNLKDQGIGNFANTGYWCSTEFTQTQAGLLNFLDGMYGYHSKTELWHIRAVRAF